LQILVLDDGQDEILLQAILQFENQQEINKSNVNEKSSATNHPSSNSIVNKNEKSLNPTNMNIKSEPIHPNSDSSQETEKTNLK